MVKFVDFILKNILFLIKIFISLRLNLINKKGIYMSVNKCILVGNVGKDPEIRYFDNDVAVANFTLATTERGFKTRDGQDVPDRTEWHNIVAWRGLAKLAESYIKKGSQIYVEGKLRTRSYDDQSGAKRYVTEVFADIIQLLGRKPQDNEQNQNAGFLSNEPRVESIANQSVPSEDNYIPGVNEVEDDLPF